MKRVALIKYARHVVN